MSLDDDLGAILADEFMSVPVVLGDWCGRGFLDELDVPDFDRGDGTVMKRVTVLRLRRSDFTATDGTLTVARGDTVTIDGTAYTLTDPRIGGADLSPLQELDGRELHLVVRKV